MCAAVRKQLSDFPGGGTQREHLEQACKQAGKTPEELGIDLPDEDDTDIPAGGEHIWAAFWELSQGRSNNGFTENPVPWREIAAFSHLSGLTLTPFEAETLRHMDATYLATRAEMSAKQ